MYPSNYGRFSTSEKRPVIDFVDNRVLNKLVGSFFDVVNVVFGYAGFLIASEYDFLKKGNIIQTLNGHSLGTLGVSNLVSRGYLDVGLAHLDSLPFGNVAPAGVTLHMGTFDVVNGFFLGKLLNPFGELRNGGFLKHDPKHIHKNGL